MKYTAPVPQSLTDKEFAGGKVFTQLVEEGTIVPYEGDVKKENCLVFQLNKYCYTCRTLPPSETRAYILMDTATLHYQSKLRLILCNGLNRKSGREELLEVLPAPDPEYPIFGNDWMHKLGWFLKAEAIGIDTYESFLRRADKGAFLNARFDLRGNTIDNLYQRLKFYEEFDAYGNYLVEQARRGSSSYGCQQRSRNYAERTKKAMSRIGNDLTLKSNYWGIMSTTAERFDVPTTYPAVVVNAAANAIESNEVNEYMFIAETLLKIAKDKGIDLTDDFQESWTTESFNQFRNKFLTLTDKYYFSIVDLSALPNYNI